MAFRVVQQSFWTDEKTMDILSCEDKYFFLYLLTNPQCNQLGIYKLPVKLAAFQLGYSKEQVIVLLDRFENVLKQIKYNTETQEIAIGHFLYHSIISGGKPVLDAVSKDILKVSDASLFEFVCSKLKHKEIANTTVLTIIEMLKSRSATNENVNDNDNDNDDTYHVSYHDSSHDTQKVKQKDKPLYSDSFLEFWNAYPNKKAKGTAYKAWQRISKEPDILKTVLSAIEIQKRSEAWQKDGGQFIPHPASWLNARRWEDEDTSGSKPTSKPKQYKTVMLDGEWVDVEVKT